MKAITQASEMIARARVQLWLRKCAHVGVDARLLGQPTVAGAARIRIGVRFYLSSIPSPSHIITGPDGVLAIGDDVSIGHGAAISAYSNVSIGSGTHIGPYAIILDTDFHAVGDREGTAQPEPIVIGSGARLGSRVTVVRGSEIGDGAVVASGSVVSGKIAAGARVSGVPARSSAALRRDPGLDSATGVAAAVPEVVMHSFGLTALPEEAHGPSHIAQWDSLGALRLLLALEEAFGVTLSEDEVMRVASVGALTAIVDRAVGAMTEPRSLK